MGCTNSKAVGVGFSAVEPSSSAVATAGDATCHPGGPASTVQAVASSVRSVSPSSDFQAPLVNDSAADTSSPTSASGQGDVIGSSYTPPPGGREGQAVAVQSLEALLKTLPPEALEETPEGRRRLVSSLALKNGDEYQGEFQGGVAEGHGVLRRADGGLYEGRFQAGRASGQGIWKSADGSLYEGQWSEGRANGRGKLLHADGSSYEGDFSNDLKDGQGTERWADGTVYVGAFVKGDKTGEGRIAFPGGAKYTGHFEADVIQGEGEYVWPDGRKYKGPFHDGLMEGSFGVYEWPAGGTGNACQISVPGVSPQGLSPSKTARLAPPGKGTPSSVSAAAAPAASFVCRYEGPFSAGQKDGNGVLFMSDGRRIEGTFIANRLEGQAVLVMPSGGSRRGLWERGTFVRWVDEVDKQKIEVQEKDDDAEEEYETCIFSNPGAYSPNIKEGKKQVVVKGGVLRTHLKR